MYKVLLVDDEEIFLSHLAGAVDWAQWGCMLCGKARDGTEALALIRRERPDVVFMDINMSAMNGLEVCAALQNQPDAPRVIIVTAHDEFAYARQAVHLGVFDYLLKPFDTGELTDSLCKCIEDIQRQASLRQDAQAAVAADYLRGLIGLRGGIVEPVPPPALAGGAAFAAAMVNTGKTDSCVPDEVLRSLRKALEPLAAATFLVEVYGGMLGLVHCLPAETRGLAMLEECYGSWLQSMGPAAGARVSIGRLVADLGGVTDSYRQATAGMENRIHVQKNIIMHEDFQHLEPQCGGYSKTDIDLLIHCFQAGEYEKADRAIEKIFAISQDKMLSFQYVVHTYVFIAVHIYSHFGQATFTMDDQMSLQGQIVRELNTCNDTAEMTAILKNYIHEVFSDCIALPSPQKNNNLAGKIDAFLLHHYPEADLTVDRIAAALFFENSYLRRVYKSHSGQTIMQRLEEIRIEKAKEFITGSDCKISQVSSMAGFSDQFYFSRRFKLYTGMTPSEYKNLKAAL